MRDLFVVGLVCGWAALALRRPWLGVLLWVFVSIVNPHRYTYGFAYTAPLAQIAAIAVLIGLLFDKSKESPFKGGAVFWLAFLTVWITISWLMGVDPSGDYYQWNKVVKVYLMVFVGLMLLREKYQIVAFAWVCAGSMAILGAKGGFFTLVTGGNYRVWGPAGSFIQDNNEFALACVITIPILRFLQMQLVSRWARLAMLVLMVLMAMAALGSHSRGALLAITAMVTILWWRSGNRALTVVPILVLAVLLIAFMPEHWMERMNSIGDYKEDGSAQGRFSAWYTAWGVAKNYFFGAGFMVARHEFFAAYSPIYSGEVHAAHSIYFQMLGNHGFIGLFAYLMIWLTTWSSAGWLRRQGRIIPEARWAGDLGAMAQVSLAGFAVGGAFLSLSYFDLPYNIMMMVVLARVWVQTRAWEREPAPGPSRWRLPGMGDPIALRNKS